MKTTILLTNTHEKLFCTYCGERIAIREKFFLVQNISNLKTGIFHEECVEFNDV